MKRFWMRMTRRRDDERRGACAEGDAGEHRLTRLIDGELGAADERDARRHLARCERCRAAYEDLQLAQSAVSHLVLLDDNFAGRDAAFAFDEFSTERRRRDERAVPTHAKAASSRVRGYCLRGLMTRTIPVPVPLAASAVLLVAIASPLLLRPNDAPPDTIEQARNPPPVTAQVIEKPVIVERVVERTVTRTRYVERRARRAAPPERDAHALEPRPATVVVAATNIPARSSKVDARIEKVSAAQRTARNARALEGFEPTRSIKIVPVEEER